MRDIISWALQFWPILISAFLCSLVGTLFCRKIALRLGVFDKPDSLVKTHAEPIAYLGGVGVFAGFCIGILVAILHLHSESYFAFVFRWFLGILVGGAIVCAVGLLDDVFDIKPWQKVLSQICAAAVLALVGIRPALNFFAEPLGVKIYPALGVFLGFIVAVVFVLGATNSLNLLDGIDGLCAGVTVVIAFGMLLLAVLLALQNPSDFHGTVGIIIALAVLGSVCGFWPFNRHPARIFLGDAGSLFLGFVVAVLMMLFAVVGPKWCLCSIVIFGLPILDTTVAFARRWLNNRPLFIPDRGHIYDQMMDRQIPLRKTVRICCLLAALYALVGLIISQVETLYTFLVCIVVFVTSVLIVWQKGFLKMQGLRGAVRKEQTEAQ